MRELICIVFLFILLGCGTVTTSLSDSTHDNSDTSTDTEPSGPNIGDIEVFAAGFSGADGITIDSVNNRMYVGNRKNNTLVYVDILGEVHDFVTVPCKELLIITTDNQGNVFAAGSDKVLKITKDGVITEIAQDFGCADDLVFDNAGNLYVTDSKRNIVYKITPEYEKSVFIANDYSGPLSNWFITGIAFDKTYENLYIVRMTLGEILKYPINPDGTAGEKEVIMSGLNEPDHIITDENNNLYVTLFRTGDLIKITPDLTKVIICDNTMTYATGLVKGKGGFDSRFIYIADYGKNKVYKIYIGENQ